MLNLRLLVGGSHLSGAGGSHEDVGGNVHIGGARPTGHGCSDGGGDEGCDVAHAPRSAGILGEARHCCHLVQLLEGPLAHFALHTSQQ